MMRAIGSNGNYFRLDVLETTSWGDLRLEFAFELGWASGKIHAVCSRERLSELESFLRKHSIKDDETFCFINEDGNLEINFTSLRTGLCKFGVNTSANMTDDDSIVFSFDGTIEI